VALNGDGSVLVVSQGNNDVFIYKLHASSSTISTILTIHGSSYDHDNSNHSGLENPLTFLQTLSMLSLAAQQQTIHNKDMSILLNLNKLFFYLKECLRKKQSS
jgi:hypothetical protein